MSSQSSTLGPNGWEINAPNERMVSGKVNPVTGRIVFLNGSDPARQPIKDLVSQPVSAAFIGNSLLAGGELAALVSKGLPSLSGAVSSGVGGNTSAMVLARVDTDIPDFVDACFYLESVNDVTTSVSYSTHMANVKAIVAKLKSRGILPSILLCGPLDGAQLATEQKYRLADALVARETGIPVFDPWADYVDPITGGWVSGSTSDGTHPTAATYYAAGAALGTKIKTMDYATLRPLYNNVAHAMIATNSLFLTDTNTDGVANNWGVIGGGAGVTPSLVSGSGDGIRGNWQKLDCVTTTGNKQLYATNITTGFSAGDVVRFDMAFKFDVTTGSPLGYAFIELIGGPSAGRKYLAYQVGVSWGAQRLSKEFVVPAGVTGMQAYVQLGGTAVSGAVYVGEFQALNITALSQ